MSDDDAHMIDWCLSDIVPSWIVPALFVGALVTLLFGWLTFRFVKHELDQDITGF